MQNIEMVNKQTGPLRSSYFQDVFGYVDIRRQHPHVLPIYIVAHVLVKRFLGHM